MVILDTTTLLLLFFPSALPPIDPGTDAPLLRCKERIELLLGTLSEGKIRILIPTPILSELLVRAGKDRNKILEAIHNQYEFSIQPFDERAAVELAFLVDKALQSPKPLTDVQTKAKLKFDRQIIAIAKVAGVKTIYSDDKGIYTVGTANGMTVIKTWQLPLPVPKSQMDLSGPGFMDLDGNGNS
jgi:hypothetical protein